MLPDGASFHAIYGIKMQYAFPPHREQGCNVEFIDHQTWSLPQLADNLLVMMQVINEMRRAERKPRLALIEGLH